MTYIDSHCHLNCLDLAEYDGQLTNVLQQALEAKVRHFLCVAVTLEDNDALLEIAKLSPYISLSAGLHPTELPGEPLDMARLKNQIPQSKVVAIGETGLDYYRTPSPELDWQRERFVQHIECAHEFKKPLIIHTRCAQQDTIEILKAHKAQEVGGVMHCFTEDWAMAKAALDLNFYISFSGIVTFKNAHQLQEVAKKVPLERMLIETDAPYLAPTPYRGKQNVPAYVVEVAAFIAQLRGLSQESIADITTQNFCNLFFPEQNPNDLFWPDN